MNKLLLEIYTEEVPYSLQKQAQTDLAKLATNYFSQADIPFTKLAVFSSSQRLTLYLEGLPSQIIDTTEVRKGPAVNAPKVAIEGFMKNSQVSLNDLLIKDTPKGIFYFANIVKKGGKLIELLPKIIQNELLCKLNFKKSMFWNSSKIAWGRPIRNILALFNSEVIPLNFAELISNNTTKGHRFLANKILTINNPDDYFKLLAENYVILDFSTRRNSIVAGTEKIATEQRITFLNNHKILDEIAYLAEYPVVLLAKIEQKYMELPKELLINIMASNQRYLNFIKKDGSLSPYFAIVTNIITNVATAKSNQNMISQNIISGNLKVLKARLEDGLFFYKQDLKKPLSSKVEALKKINFFEGLGSLFDKKERVKLLLRELFKTRVTKIRSLSTAQTHSKSARPKQAHHEQILTQETIELLGNLYKADLSTALVGEIPELQGIIGYYYFLDEVLLTEKNLHVDALQENKVQDVEIASLVSFPQTAMLQKQPHGKLPHQELLPQELLQFSTEIQPKSEIKIAKATIAIATAVKEHYKPLGSEDDLPSNLLGAKLAVSDKLDTLISFFSINKKPTNKGDPFALRRTALGIIRICIAYELNLVLDKFITQELKEFFLERLQVYLKGLGHNQFVVTAVCNSKFELNILEINKKILFLEEFIKTKESISFIGTYKRLANLIKHNIISSTTIAKNLLVEEAEQKLFQNFNNLTLKLNTAVAEYNYAVAINLLLRIVADINTMLDSVMVNAEDKNLKNNRLRLLNNILVAIQKIAYFEIINSD